MTIRDFVRQCVMQFFIITSCVTLATAVIGPHLLPDLQVTYDLFYSPLIIGLVCTLPSILLYSKQELNLRRTIFRRCLHLLAIEILLSSLNWYAGNLKTVPDLLLFMITVLGIYLIVNLISWLMESRDAKVINDGLKKLQSRD